MRRRLVLTLFAILLALPATAGAAPGDPVHPADLLEDGWKLRYWYQYGNPAHGELSAESWVDLHWPCFSATDEDQDCMIEDVRGHGVVRKVYRVQRVQIDFTRLGRYPSGVLAENHTNRNSGTLPLVEHTTAWVATQQFCGQASFRAWNRVTFDARWYNNRLTPGLTLLSDPTDEHSSAICGVAALTAAQRQALRQQLANN